VTGWLHVTQTVNKATLAQDSIIIAKHSLQTCTNAYLSTIDQSRHCVHVKCRILTFPLEMVSSSHVYYLYSQSIKAHSPDRLTNFSRGTWPCWRFLKFFRTSCEATLEAKVVLNPLYFRIVSLKFDFLQQQMSPSTVCRPRNRRLPGAFPGGNISSGQPTSVRKRLNSLRFSASMLIKPLAQLCSRCCWWTVSV
jgi:hypothetical protein